jgi:hypothetical protein
MKKVLFSSTILFLWACTKTEQTTTPPPPVVIQEESIKFSTNLDTGTFYIADTLPLEIKMNSTLPLSLIHI